MNVPDATSHPAQVVCCAPLGADVIDDEQAHQLAAVMKALADPVRLRLVSIVAAAPGHEVCACDLPELLDRSQPTTSHHLSLLVRAGVLEREQRGKWAWFRLRHDQLRAVGDILAPSAVRDDHSTLVD
ncbi:MAG: metalloregulator ArsR/SmtB family transcription factor [Ilumatobacteraceae bacterium]|jgi:ArsR family transcriptional regulator|nr:metalloregulator ArsR/SmtB family transcription factor [Ilumatobacteraceae bacterium]